MTPKKHAAYCMIAPALNGRWVALLYWSQILYIPDWYWYKYTSGTGTGTDIAGTCF
jgi:hypothetical protein